MRLRSAATLPRQGLVVGAIGSAAVHLFVAVLMVASVALRPAARQPVIYSVELVAAPASRPQARPVTRAPAPPPPPSVATRPAPAKPVPKAPPKVDPKTEATTRPAEVAPPNPGVTPGTGTDVENVRVEGIAFPFPEYLRNIMNQIFKRWARPVGVPLSAEVSFTIMRDGSVRNIRIIRSSRVYAFDLEAQGAVEQAAADRAFGPLPRGWEPDVLNVAFLFTPRAQ